jgi:RNA polymerase sigma factor (sigma-70 family)
VATQPSDKAWGKRLLPDDGLDQQDQGCAERACAWTEWQQGAGELALRKFIRVHNTTTEPDEDIAQEAMLTAYLAVERGDYRPREGVPFMAYIKGIARNKLREARRRGREWVALEDDSESSPERAALRTAPRQTEVDVEQRERRASFWRCLAHLAQDQRQVLQRCWQGESTREIARAMAISEEAARQHKSRGLRQLRASLAEQAWEAETPKRTSEGMWEGCRNKSDRGSHLPR